MSAPARAFTPGQLVQIGNGVKVWKLAYFWRAADGTEMAALGPTDRSSYSGTSVAVSRLKPVSS